MSGDRRGRELGFPTANIVPPDHLAHPGHGVYAAWAHGHMAAVNVGVRPTFDTGRGLLVEAYLIDFDADLYGETLRIAFAQPTARGTALRERRGAGRADEARRGGRPSHPRRVKPMKPLLLCTSDPPGLRPGRRRRRSSPASTSQDRRWSCGPTTDNVPIQFGMRWRARVRGRQATSCTQTTFLQPFTRELRDARPRRRARTRPTCATSEDGATSSASGPACAAAVSPIASGAAGSECTMTVYRNDRFVTDCGTGRVRWQRNALSRGRRGCYGFRADVTDG